MNRDRQSFDDDNSSTSWPIFAKPAGRLAGGEARSFREDNAHRDDLTAKVAGAKVG